LLQQVQDGNFASATMAVTLVPGPVVTMKFDEVLGSIIVPLTLQNQEKVNFLIDTGCSTSLIDARIASRFDLTGTDYFPVAGIGAGVGLAVIADNVSIVGSGLSITGARLPLVQHFDFDEYLGHPLGGVIGADLLKHFVLKIDYATRTLTLALPGHLPQDPKTAFLPMDVTNNCPFVKASVGDGLTGKTEGQFLLDTGDSGSVSLTRAFLIDHPALPVTSLFSSGAIGFGGIERTGVGRGTFNLGGFAFKNAVMALSQNVQGAWAGLEGGDIGRGILDRFTVTFDFPAHKLYLQPTASLNRPFGYSDCGLAVKTTGGDYKTFVVYEVVPDTPAAGVDFRKGDQVVTFDRQPAGAMTMDEIYDLLGREGVHAVQVRRKGADLTLPLTVFDAFAHPEQLALYRSAPPSGQDAPKIQSISVTAASIFPDDVIIRAAGLKIGDPDFPWTSGRALKRLYATGLFEKAGFDVKDAVGGVTVNIILALNPVVDGIAFTGLTPKEEAEIRPQLATEEGKRVSGFDLFQDAALIRQILGKTNPAERKVTMDVDVDDLSKHHQEIIIPKSDP